jgi:ankyrin repeat protein
VGNTAIARELISHGASLNARDGDGWTALNMAVHTGHVGFVELLLNAGASLDGQAFTGSIEDFLNWTLLYGTGTKEAMKKMLPIIEFARSKQDECPTKSESSE